MTETLFQPTLDWSSVNAVRTVSARTAAKWFGEYHYSGTPGISSAWFYGVGAPDTWLLVAIGVTSNTHGVSRTLGLNRWKGNVEITRVARHPESEFLVSQGVAKVLTAYHQATGVDWVFSYADTAYGHQGGIYQALNATYVGCALGGEALPNWEIWRDGNWVPIHARTVGAICGTGRSGAVGRFAARGMELRESGKPKPKHTYVLPIGDSKSRALIRRALRPHAKPYPKRADGLGEKPRSHQAGSAGAMPALRSMPQAQLETT